MEKQRKLVILELLSGLFGWTWIIASIGALYFFVSAIAFSGIWSSFIWAIGVGAGAKWITRVIEKNRMKSSLNFESSPEIKIAKDISHENRLLIISDFGRFIENEKDPTAIKDVNCLPHSKDKIVDAILEEYVLQNDDKILEILKTGLMFISDYQEGIGPEPLTQLGISFEELQGSVDSDDDFDPEEFKKELDKIANNPSKTKFEHYRFIADDELNSYYKKIDTLDRLKDKIYSKTSIIKNNPWGHQ